MRSLAGSSVRVSDSIFRSSRVILSRSDSILRLSDHMGKSGLVRSSKCGGEAWLVEEALERLRERKEKKTPSWLLVLKFARGWNLSWLIMESQEGLSGGRPLILKDLTSLKIEVNSLNRS